MITLNKNETGIIRITKSGKLLYTISEKTYKCISKLGLGSAHIIDMIRNLYKDVLQEDEKEAIHSYFTKVDEETKAFSKSK